MVDIIEDNFDDKLKVLESLINLENKIFKNIEDKPRGCAELDRVKIVKSIEYIL